MSKTEYSAAELAWVAAKLEATSRAELFSGFAKKFGKPLDRNRLAGMMHRHGGGKAGFIAKHHKRTKKTSVPARVIVPGDQEQETLERAFARLQALWPEEKASFEESPDFSRDPQAQEKRAGVKELIRFALSSLRPGNKFALRALQRRSGVSEFLSQAGYTPRFAKLVEEVLDLHQRRA